MPYLRQSSLTGIPASASFKIATMWLSVMRLLIVKLLWFSLKEILRVSCIILRGSYTVDVSEINLQLLTGLGFESNNWVVRFWLFKLRYILSQLSHAAFITLGFYLSKENPCPYPIRLSGFYSFKKICLVRA